MHSDEYRRLHAACIAMAAQSGSPDAKARWLTLAEACSGLAKGPRDDRALGNGPDGPPGADPVPRLCVRRKVMRPSWPRCRIPSAAAGSFAFRRRVIWTAL